MRNAGGQIAYGTDLFDAKDALQDALAAVAAAAGGPDPLRAAVEVPGDGA